MAKKTWLKRSKKYDSGKKIWMGSWFHIDRGNCIDAVYAKAMAQKDYYKAVRIVYLRTLRWLSDGNKISWQLYKTPTQYTREYLSVEFERMTTAFMRVRYGNYQASEELVELLLDLESKIKKGGKE